MYLFSFYIYNDVFFWWGRELIASLCSTNKVHNFHRNLCLDLITGLKFISSDWLAGAPSFLGHLLCRTEIWMSTAHLTQTLASNYLAVTGYVISAQTAKVPSSHALILSITTQRTPRPLVCLWRTYCILQHGETVQKVVPFRHRSLSGMNHVLHLYFF